MSVILPEPDGPRDYVINTIIADGEGTKEVTLHAITGFSWIEKAALPTITVDPETLIVGRETELLITVKEGGKPLHIIANPPDGSPFRINGTVDIGDLVIGHRLDDNGQAKVVVKPEKVGPIEIKSYLLGRFVIGETINAVMPEVPKQPQGLNAARGDRKAVLTWFPNSEPEVRGYYVYQVVDNRWEKIHPGIVEYDGSGGLVSHEVTGLNDNTTYTFQVSAVDVFNRESVPSEPAQVTLTIPEDTISPWVIGSNPINRQKDAPVDITKIQIFFSENIALWRTYEDIAVKIGDVTTRVGDAPAEFTVEAEVGTNVLTITLNEELPIKTRCEVLIPEGAVRDKFFNELKNENEGNYAYKLEFFTEAENDTISPMLIAVTPKENARLVTVHSTIFLYFSEEIQKGLAYDNIRLIANGMDIPHSKEITGAKIIIKPLRELPGEGDPQIGVLPYDSKIEIFVPEEAVVDSAGNKLELQHTLRFYTDTVPDLTAPKIIRMRPSANSVEIHLNTRFEIYFSERVKEGETFENIAIKAENQILPVVVIIEGNKLLIKPSENLPPNKLCQLYIPANAIEDLLGNSLQEEFEALVVTGGSS
jgi:methionine-rich copper-binding protein CopC